MEAMNSLSHPIKHNTEHDSHWGYITKNIRIQYVSVQTLAKCMLVKVLQISKASLAQYLKIW